MTIRLPRFPAGFLPLVKFHHSLPPTDRGRGHLDQLCTGDEFDGAFEGHLFGRLELDRVVGAGCANVRELLALGDVDFEVAGAGVLADDHALVDVDTGTDEELAALLEIPE